MADHGDHGLAQQLVFGSGDGQNTKHFFAGAGNTPHSKCKKCGKRHKKGHKCKK